MSLIKAMRAWFHRLAGLFQGQQRDAEFSAELESHLQLNIEDSLRRGMTPEAARREALMKLGGIEQTKEDYRDRRSLPLLETLLEDLRLGIRILSKNPGFAAVAISTLALGIGVNTALFCWIQTIVLNPIPGAADPSRLVTVVQQDRGNIPTSRMS